MTLSHFLRDYLYVPLGGNRKGPVRRYGNLMTTMLLGGLWHGAGWTFMIWGGLHGLYLMLNHVWQGLWRKAGPEVGPRNLALHIAGCGLTFLAVVIAWVFFRAADVGSAVHMLKGMAGLNGVSLPIGLQGDARFAWLANSGAVFQGLLTNANATAAEAIAWIGVLLMAVWLLPNTQQFTRDFDPAVGPVAAPATLARLKWRPSPRWAMFSGGVLALGLLSLNRVSAFLYFQF